MRTAALLLLLALALPAAAQSPVGMITDLKGDVRLDPAGAAAERKADILAQVAPGDGLVLGPGASCTLTFYSDGHREKLSGPAKAQVAATGLSGASVQKVAASAALAGLRPRAPAGRARTAVAMRAPGESVVEVPGPARVPAGKPAFRLPRDGATAEIRDASGAVLLTDTLMGDEVWVVPLRDPKSRQEVALKPGVDYRLVVLEDGGGELAARIFQVVAERPGEEERLLELDAMAGADRADPTPWIARAAMLEEAGLKDLALDSVLEALARSPSPSLQLWAADLCEAVGRPAEARAWRALAGGGE